MGEYMGNLLNWQQPVTMQPTATLKMFQPTRRMMAMPNEEHRAHTISQRLRTLKKIPPELIPLGIVVGVAVGFAGYSMPESSLSTSRCVFLARTERIRVCIRGAMGCWIAT